MNIMFHKYYTQIPEKDKKEIIMELTRENLYRLLICMIILVCIETFIYVFLRKYIIGTDTVVFYLIFYNLLFISVTFIIHKRLDTKILWAAKIDQYLYISGLFLFCCALCLIPQRDYATSDTYIIAVFATAAILYLDPIESLFMFLGIYTVFFCALPLYQSDPGIVFYLRVNAFFMNLFAWIIARVVYEMKMVTIFDKKTIEHNNDLLKEMAIKDSMTSLLNHENTYYKLYDEVNKARSKRTSLSAIMLDIDNFKLINDTYGHQAGDTVIIGISRIIVENCRVTDITGRYGGEEFLIIMPGTDLEQAGMIAERIRTLVESTNFDMRIHVTISAGVCQYSDESAEDLIKRTDDYLYRAKNRGRNRIEGSTILLN